MCSLHVISADEVQIGNYKRLVNDSRVRAGGTLGGETTIREANKAEKKVKC